MANLPNDPVNIIPEPERQNADVPAHAFPQLERIERTDLVGPTAANRQHKALERRTDVLREAVNSLIQLVNELDNKFLRKDNTLAKDGVVGPTAALSMNAKKLINIAEGVIADGSKEAVVGGQLYEAITQFAAAIASLTTDSQWSVTNGPDGKLKLVNDNITPPGNAYYGTDINGVRGYHSLPNQSAAATLPNTRTEFVTAGTFNWVVPAGVTEIYVTIRAGNGGDSNDITFQTGGGSGSES